MEIIVTVIAALEGDEPVGFACQSFASVSLEPPLAMFSVQKQSTTWPLIARSERIGVSILSAGHGPSCRQLAGRDKSARFEGVATRATAAGALRIEESAAWFDCSVYDVHEAGDHNVVFFQIHDLEMDKSRDPLVFHGSKFTRLAD